MNTPTRRWDYFFLLAFAFTAVASIALQNLIWVAAVALLLMHWREKKSIDWPRNLFVYATLLFLTSFYLACLLGINPAKSFETVHKYLVFTALFFVGAMALAWKDLMTILWTFVAGTCVCAVHGIYKYFIYHEERIDSFSGDKMVFGGMLMSALLLEIFLLRREKGRFWALGAIALTAFALFLTQTRGAWMGFVVGLTILMWRSNRKILLGLFALAFAGYFILPTHFQDRIKSIGYIHLQYDDQHHIVYAQPERIMIWIAGWEIFQDHPWGIGQGNIVDIYPKYKLKYMWEPNEPHLHDNYLQILVQNGWIGLLVYLFWIGAYYYETFRFKSSNPGAQELNWTFLCAFTAVLVWGLSEYTFAQQFSTVFAFLLGLQMTLWKQETSR